MRRRPSSSGRSLVEALFEYRYHLSVLVILLVAVAAWFAEDLGALFASSPKAKDIAGSWVFAKEAYDQMIDTALTNAGTPAKSAPHRRDQLRRAAQPYAGITYTFEAETFRMDCPGRSASYPCVIFGESSNVIEVHPNVEGVAPLTMVVNKEKAMLYIIGPELAIPLMRAP